MTEDNKVTTFEKGKNDAPFYVSYRNKWRVVIGGKPFYFDEYVDALNKWKDIDEKSNSI